MLTRVAGVNVVAEVEGAVAEVAEGHFQDTANAKLVDMVHGVGVDVQVAQDLALALVNVPQPNVHQLGLCEGRGREG